MHYKSITTTIMHYLFLFKGAGKSMRINCCKNSMFEVSAGMDSTFVGLTCSTRSHYFQFVREKNKDTIVKCNHMCDTEGAPHQMQHQQLE